MHASFASSPSRELCHQARDLQSEFGLSLNRDQVNRLGGYLDVLRKWQERVNLISEPSPERLLRLHFLESFWLAEHFLEDRSVLTDLGSGAGFPGLAAKLYRPMLTVSLVEKNAKKVLFLEEVTRRLKLRGVSIFSRRWEEYEAWQPGGIVSIRALKVSPELLERLAAQRQTVLLLHTSYVPKQWNKWRVINPLRVPGSRQRVATQLACLGTKILRG